MTFNEWWAMTDGEGRSYQECWKAAQAAAPMGQDMTLVERCKIAQSMTPADINEQVRLAKFSIRINDRHEACHILGNALEAAHARIRDLECEVLDLKGACHIHFAKNERLFSLLKAQNDTSCEP